MTNGPDMEDELRRELEHVRAERDRLDRQLDDLMARVRELENARAQATDDRVEALQEKLDGIHRSTTWRLGRALMLPPRLLTGRGHGDARRITKRVRRRFGDVGQFKASRPAEPAHELTADHRARDRYEAALARRLVDPRRRGVAFAVSTADLEAGRGDLFTALGLGSALERRGWEAVYLPPDRWYAPPPGVEVYVSMVAEPDHVLDPVRLPTVDLLVAWIRNNTDDWLARGALSLYDGILCSSERTRATVVAAGFDAGVFPIGVDAQLFRPADDVDRHGVATTINQWGSDRRTYRVLADLVRSSGGAPFPLTIYGTQRGLDEVLDPFRQGRTSFLQLPDLYRQVHLVLDDQQPNNAVFGNVNSRIFESLAVGALPLTASPSGLDELGLEAVPTYHAAHDLQALIAELLTNDERRRGLVSRLQEVVLAQHTYDHRADEFLALVEEFRPGDVPSEARSAAVLAFHPDYRRTNPYQSMLYREFRDGGVEVLPGRRLEQFVDARNPRRTPRIFHQHWTATILGPATDDADARRRLDEHLSAIDRFRAAGGIYVWTIHNVMPHECARPDLERELRQGIADRADVIHVMCRDTANAVAGDYSLPADRVVVIPHPSYAGVYPNVVTRGRARRELRLREDEYVYLCLGQIRPYKGIERLLDSFTRVRAGRSCRLVIAGEAGRFPGVGRLIRRGRWTRGVKMVARAVSDDDLQVYLAAADAVVLPHRRVLNSGLAMLAVTFGRPVVAPDTGCLGGVAADGLGVTFPAEAPDLAAALRSVRDLDILDVARRAAAMSEGRRPRVISQQLLGTLVPLLTSDGTAPVVDRGGSS